MRTLLLCDCLRLVSTERNVSSDVEQKTHILRDYKLSKQTSAKVIQHRAPYNALATYHSCTGLFGDLREFSLMSVL